MVVVVVGLGRQAAEAADEGEAEEAELGGLLLLARGLLTNEIGTPDPR